MPAGCSTNTSGAAASAGRGRGGTTVAVPCVARGRIEDPAAGAIESYRAARRQRDLPLGKPRRWSTDLFRKVADLYARDGVITDKERSKLEVLARALEIDPARADRIEAEAKAARYQQAVSEALADGTVTEEEARLLNRLRIAARHQGVGLDSG